MTGKMKKRIAIPVLSVCCAVTMCFGISLGALNSANAESVTDKTIATTDLFEGTDAIKLQANVDSPDFVTNGYAPIYRGTAEVVDGFREKEGESVRYVPEYHMNGVKATFTAAKHSLTFKNIIDVSKLTIDTPLFDFLPVVQTRGTVETPKITVRIEDVYDPNNYIAVVFADVVGSETRTRISAYTDKIEKMGYYWGAASPGAETSPDGPRTYNINLGNISTFATLPAGATTKEGLVAPYSIRLDPKDYTITMRRESYYSLFDPSSGVTGDTGILTLTDEKAVGAGNAFQGFTNDRAKISITIDTLSAVSADIMIYNVNGQPMGGETIVDETAPDLSVYAPKSGIPKAIPNQTYQLFDFVATDMLNGVCTDTIYIKEPNSNSFNKYVGTEFTPTKVGEYVIRYESKDGFGNTAVKDFTVQCSWLVEGMTITHDAPERTDYAVGDTVKIPNYKVVGGAGDITSKYEVYRVSDGSSVAIKDGTFLPKIAGEYRIVYSAQDYLGVCADKAFVVNVSSNKKPILSGTLNVPSTVLDGVKLQLPTIDSLDYDSVPGVVLNAKLKITVSGNGVSEELEENRLFTPSLAKFGTDIKITYKYYCRNYPNDAGTVKEFDCKIKKATYAYDYFDYDEKKVGVSYNEDSSKSFIRFALKEADDSATISFINPVIASSAIVNFEVEKAYQSFGALRVTFTDMNDTEIGFSVDVKKNDKLTSTLTYLGESFNFSGSFNNDQDVAEVPLGIGYSNGNVVNYNSAKICEVTQNFDGSKFNGFPSNYVKISISFVGSRVDDTADAATGIKLLKIRKQSFYMSYANGNVAPFKDIVRPDVVYEFDAARSYKIGDVFEIPVALGCDELTPYMDVYVTVSDPNFNKIINKQLVRAGMTFKVESFGDYVVEYVAYDGANLKCQASAFYLSIQDRVSPTITISDATPIECKLGETVALPEIVVLDNFSEVSVTLFAIDENNEYLAIEGTVTEDGQLVYTWQAEKTGTYRMMFYVYDENFNSTFAEMTIIVKE